MCSAPSAQARLPRCLTALTLALMLASPAALARPAKPAPAIARCDALAADPWDPLRSAAGVAAGDIAAAKAVTACRAAVAAAPEEPRLHHQLGRALEAAGQEVAASRAFAAAARRGYGPAQYAAATLTADVDKAAAWAQGSAELGYAPGCDLLADMYEDGRGMPLDSAAAYSWAERAAEQGLANAQARLARYYRDGFGTVADPIQAARWFRLAALQGHAEAQFELASLMLDEDSTSKRDKAMYWLTRAAEKGHVPAQLELGLLRLAGEHTPVNATQAVAWLRRAAERGSAPAQQALAALDDGGVDTDVDPLDLEHWGRALGEAADPDVLYALGRFFESRSDTAQARAYLEKAVASGHVDADLALAMLAD